MYSLEVDISYNVTLYLFAVDGVRRIMLREYCCRWWTVGLSFICSIHGDVLAVRFSLVLTRRVSFKFFD